MSTDPLFKTSRGWSQEPDGSVSAGGQVLITIENAAPDGASNEERHQNACLFAMAFDRALALRMMARGVLRWEPYRAGLGNGELCFAGLRYATCLDSHGCPFLTNNLRAALLASEGVRA